MTVARVASLAGFATLAGILAIEVIVPSFTVGTAVTGSTDRTVIERYYAQDALVPLGLAGFVVIVGFIVFVTALREVLAQTQAGSIWANAGFAFALVASALLLVRSALQMALVRTVLADGDVLPLFFAYDFTYNAALYAMEASYPLAFAMAMTAVGSPRWLLGLAVLVSGLQFVNMASLVIGLPMAATMPGTLAFAAWFAASAWLVGRSAPVVAASPRTITA